MIVGYRFAIRAEDARDALHADRRVVGRGKSRRRGRLSRSGGG